MYHPSKSQNYIYYHNIHFYPKRSFMIFRSLLAFSAIAVFFCIGCHNSNPASPPVAGPTELEGVWSGTSDADTIVPKPTLTYSFANNKIVVTRDTCSPKDLPPCNVESFRGTFVLDTNASPRTIDIHISQSAFAQYQNKTILAVYNKSVNVLTISANGPGTSRPTSLDGGTNINLMQ
jgi:hypothetical protein